MKKEIQLILLLLFTVNLYSQTYNNIVSDSIVNELLIFEIDNSPKTYDDQKWWEKRINSIPIPWSEVMISIYSPEIADFEFQKKVLIERDKQYNQELKNLTELFSESDFNYMKKQFNSENKIKWNFKIKKGRIKNNPKRKYYTYSIPLFNKKNTKEILYSEFGGGCSHCGGANMLIYFKNDNNWKLYKSIPLWDN